MKTAFRESLIDHIQRHNTRTVDLVKSTGVSRAKINKLLARQNDKVEVEDAIALAAFYGKSVTEFIGGVAEKPQAALSALALLLSDDEATLLQAQIRGMLAARDPVEPEPEAQKDE